MEGVDTVEGQYPIMGDKRFPFYVREKVAQIRVYNNHNQPTKH